MRCRVQVARRWWILVDLLGLGSSWMLQEGAVIVGVWKVLWRLRQQGPQGCSGVERILPGR